MGDTVKNEKKVDAAAQGAGEQTTKLETEESATVDSVPSSQVGDVPSWVMEMFEAIDDLTDAIEELKQEVQGLKSEGTQSGVALSQERKQVLIKAKAKYVVANGKAFKDKLTGRVMKEGEELVKFSPERLQILFEQGIIEEKD